MCFNPRAREGRDENQIRKERDKYERNYVETFGHK